MPTQRLKNQHIRKLTKLGSHSFGLTLPIEAVRALGWKERQKLNVKRMGKTIVITDWK